MTIKDDYVIYNIKKGILVPNFSVDFYRETDGSKPVRILYFFDMNRIIIATNGFIKKQQKTPRSEIDLAKLRRADYHRRKEAGIYE